MIAVRQCQNVHGGEVSFIGSAFFGPPRFAQYVAHSAEIVAGFGAGRAGIEKTAYFFEPVRQYVHDDHNVRKIKGGVSGVQRLKQAGSHIELAFEGLAALDGTIFLSDHIIRCAAG